MPIVLDHAPSTAPIRFAVAPSSLGLVAVAARGTVFVAAALAEQRAALVAELQKRFPDEEMTEVDVQDSTLAAGFALVAGASVEHPVSVDPGGTAWQREVWAALLDVAPGNATTYAALARNLRDVDATRAVAGACAANPIAVLIPCHRVISGDGDLTGYRWGLERKRSLLVREGFRGSHATAQTTLDF